MPVGAKPNMRFEVRERCAASANPAPAERTQLEAYLRTLLAPPRTTSRGPIESHHRTMRGEVVELGDDRWVVELLTADGRPLAGAQVRVRTFMPEDITVAARPASARFLGAGRYEIARLAMDRAGWWNVSLSVSTGGRGDSLAFNLILPVE